MVRFISEEVKVDKTTYKGGLKLICAGLPRSGTTSLKSALDNDLNYGPCMHMEHVMPFVHMIKLCTAAQDEEDKVKRQKILHEIFDGFVSAADYPCQIFVEDLVEMYPDAKLILNMRGSPEAWRKSVAGSLQYFSGMTYHVTTYLIPTDYHMHFLQTSLQRLWFKRYGIESFWNIETYNTHNDQIRRIVKEHGKELLEWTVAQGWEPLCAFLERPVPDKPFPRLNDANFIMFLTAILTVRGLAAWGAVFAAPVLSWYMARKMWTWV